MIHSECNKISGLIPELCKEFLIYTDVAKKSYYFHSEEFGNQTNF
jgi:hypothetical protein